MKTENYQNLRRELQKIWSMKVKVIPLVVGSIGSITKQFGNRSKKTGITAEIRQVQKTVFIRKARILRKVLGI